MCELKKCFTNAPNAFQNDQDYLTFDYIYIRDIIYASYSAVVLMTLLQV